MACLRFVPVLSAALLPALLQAAPTEDVRLSGGETTVFSSHAGAFSLNSANMSARRKGDFLIGNDFFEDPWVIAPATTDLRDGLGPLFNVSACQSCHFNDGRGHAPMSADDNADSLLIRLSLQKPDGKIEGDPIYGGQLQDHSIPGLKAEARIRVSYEDYPVTFTDGSEVMLRKPTFRLTDWSDGAPSPDLILSMRVAPPVIGMGLLEAIAQSDLEALADPEDRNKDGISGRLNLTVDQVSGKETLGRFGWKAGQPSVRQQTAGAFNGDMGLTTSLFPAEGCTTAQVTCRQLPNGNDPQSGVEVRDDILDFVTHYVSNLAVPARREVNASEVIMGQQLFRDAGCSGCHVERFVTAEQGPARIEQSRQIIRPYTDLLLHDMGPELADRRLDGTAASVNHLSEGLANAQEWRTPPLWGIGLTQVVNAEATFLHDGRARSIMEAILWHDGEAAGSRSHVLGYDATQRQALLAFLNSL